VVLVALAVSTTAAHAADRIYWANFGSPERISFANFDGAGGVDLNTAGALVKAPIGLALDPAGGRAYWTNESSPGGVSFANLDGSGGAGNLNTGAATVKGPSGAAIDPVARRIYWGNVGDGTIGWANLDGSGGGNLNTGAATVNGAYGLEVDPVARKVYWTNSVKNGVISWANLDGSGGADLPITGSATLEYPFGLAIDPVDRRIYWANDIVSGKISYANLDGSNSADLNTTGATVSEPYGIAVDPDEHRLYWANSNGGVGSADTTGTRGAILLPIEPGFASGAPNFPNLLETPRVTAAPVVSGLAKPGSLQNCTSAHWKEDIVSASLYRAPTSTSFQWSRDGAPIGGAVTTTLKAPGVGEYSCLQTLANPAGAWTLTSNPTFIFKIGKPVLNRKKGTAKLPVTLPVKGLLTITGGGFKKTVEGVSSAMIVEVRIRALGRPLKRLNAAGKLRLNLHFEFRNFSDSYGTAVSQTKPIVLRKK
jgi:hypothetical protein